MKVIEEYKGIKIKYRPEDGRLVFEFEGDVRDAAYLFEAKRIIDEPHWEPCSLEGYWVDGVFNDYIGLAKAVRKDTKSGRPDWMLKGQYDTEFKSAGLGWRADHEKVYPRTEERDAVYREWERQREIVSAEKSKAQSIIKKLKSAAAN